MFFVMVSCYQHTIDVCVYGQTWTQVATGGNDLSGVAYGHGVFVAVGEGGRRIRSTDNGQTWDDNIEDGSATLLGVAYGG